MPLSLELSLVMLDKKNTILKHQNKLFYHKEQHIMKHIDFFVTTRQLLKHEK